LLPEEKETYEDQGESEKPNLTLNLETGSNGPIVVSEKEVRNEIW
jgi:hypothetical protein